MKNGFCRFFAFLQVFAFEAGANQTAGDLTLPKTLRVLVLSLSTLLVPDFALAHLGHLGDVAGHSHWIAWGVGLAAAVLAALLGKGKVKDGETDTQTDADSEEQPEPEHAGVLWMSLNNLNEKTGIMICGHGSRNQNAVREFAVLAEHMKARFPHWLVDYGYLEFANPVITHGLDALKAKGVNHILAVPGMLFAAGHAKNDIPSVLNTWAAQNPDVKIDYGRELGIDLKMIRAAGDRIRRVAASSPGGKMASRCMTRCWWSSGAARFRSGCQLQCIQGNAHALGRAWLWLGQRPPIPVSRSRWWNRRLNMSPSSASSALSFSLTSCSPVFW